MRPIVPFVHRLDDEQEALWLSALRAVGSDLDIVASHTLTWQQADAAEVAIVANPDPDALAPMPKLKWVHSLWAGVETLMPALEGSGLKVARLVDDILSETMAEAVLAWSLYLHRDMPRYHAQQVTKTWRQWPVVRAQDRMIGVLGLGHLGAVAASRLAANGFNVLGWSRSPKVMDDVTTFCGEDGLTDLLSQSDIVVALLPVTPETTDLLNAQRLSTMKKGASLINFARGAILDHKALVTSLDSGALSHAVLDVFRAEPLLSDSPLWTHPHITILPHISAPTNKQSAAAQVTGTIAAWYRDGTEPVFVEAGRGY
jgi:glyoxylate/hydroxypyruvate reductase